MAMTKRVACLAVLLGWSTAFAQQTFRATVDLVGVDVQVLTRDGQPIPSLTAADFQVWINGHPRRVVSADFVTYPLKGDPKDAPARVPSMAAVAVETPARVNGRMVILAVDEASLEPNVARSAMRAAEKFIEQLPPEDVIGVYPFPISPMKLNLVHDHAQAVKQLVNIGGRLSSVSSEIFLGLGDVIDITSGDRRALQEVQDRECRDLTLFSRQACDQAVIGEAYSKAAFFESQYMQTLGSLRLLLQSLGRLPGRKVLVLVSGGLATSDRIGGRPDVKSMIKSAVEDASASNVVVYALQVDSTFLDSISASNKKTFDPGARSRAVSRDKTAQASGLEHVAGNAGGAVFRDEVGAGEVGFARVLRETSGYYLLGVETVATDRDGRAHTIRVKVNAKSATVRATTQVVIPVTRPKIQN